jgi:hypothetical protein
MTEEAWEAEREKVGVSLLCGIVKQEQQEDFSFEHLNFIY